MDSLRAHITLIPKKGKDSLYCPNYCLISLLNVDVKLLRVCQKIIHHDQVGFIPTREAQNKVVKTMDVLHLAQSKHIPMLLLSINAEKALDLMDWTFMELTIKHNDLSKWMMTWIRAVYL